MRKPTVNPRAKRRLILSTAVVGGLATVIAGGLVARTWYRSAQLAERRRDGLELFAQGRYAEALDPLSFAARNNQDIESVLALAECRMRMPESNGRHLTTAAAYFRAVEARDQTNLRAMKGLLEAYIGLGRLPEIAPLARRILAITPNDLRTHEIELEVLNLTGKFAEAAARARELQNLDPANARWRAAELLCLERSGADAPGRLARVREWRTEPTLAADASLALLEADLLRELGRAGDAREGLRTLATAGTRDRRTLEAMIAAIEAAGFDATERETLVERAIASSHGAFAGTSDATEIEGERLLRAGRFEQIQAKFGNADAGAPGVFRLRFAQLYLSGHHDEAVAFARADAESHAGSHAAAEQNRDAFRVAALAAVSDAPARERIEAIGGPNRACPKDPVAAVLLSDIMLEAGEFDEAQAILVQAFEQSGDSFQPLGVRAVRTSVALGRLRDAFRIAEELLVRYGPSGDVAVAMVSVEAWAAVLEANHRPTTRGGVFGTDSPEALRRFWTSLGGQGAQYGPASLAPAIADVFLSRGDRTTAREILENAVATGGEGLGDLQGARMSRALRTASSIDPALQGAILSRIGGGSNGSEIAAVVAERFIAQGDRDAALRAIEGALPTAEGTDKRRLERLRRPLVDATGIDAWLAAELRASPTMDTAVFVLARAEPWAASDDRLVREAVECMRSVLGPDSLRVLVADAAMALRFHADDPSRIAGAIASLDQAALRSPDSASVLTTLAALFENQDPPRFDRSAALLARAVAAEPGSAATYPQLVNALQQTGDFDGAEAALEAYIAIAGDDLQSQRSAADLRARQGQLAESARIREQLVGRSKEVVDTIALARIRQRLGEVAAAEQLLRSLRTTLSAATATDDASAHARELLVERELALVSARDGRMADARASLDAAEPRLGGARLDEVRANVELAFGDIEKARQLAERLVAGEATANRELLLARVLIRQNDLAAARAALTRSLILDPDNPDATAVAGALLVGDPTARALLDRSLAAASSRRPDLSAAIAVLDSVTGADGRISPTEQALARAVTLTTEYSASPLAWRVAAQLHLLADRKDDAFRLAQRALSRLPNDPAIGKLATETAMAAGRIDDAASCALAWRKMAAAEPLEVDVARAAIELMSKRPAAGFAIVAPMTKEILRRTGDASAMRTLVSCAVLGGHGSDLEQALTLLPPERRGDFVSAWIECAQTLPVESAAPSIELVAKVAEGDPIAMAACVSAWTSLCRAGHADACARAADVLARIEVTAVPTTLLAADLAAARGESTAALEAYRAQFLPLISAISGSATPDLASIAPKAREDARLIDALRQNPTAIVALHNAADCILTTGGDAREAVLYAQIAHAAIPDSPDALDTLASAYTAAGRWDDAAAAAARNPDAILAAVGAAELAVARRSFEEARRALLRAEARLQSADLPSRSMNDRMARLQKSIAGSQSEANASQEGTEG